MKNPIIFLSCLLGFLLTIPFTHSQAQSVSGKIFYQAPNATSPELRTLNGVTFQTDELLARVVTDNEKSPFHQTTGVCRNWVVAKGEGETFTHGLCIMADQEGDTFVVYNTFNSKDKNIITHVKGGTGKFSQLDGTGTASEIGPAHTNEEGDCCMQSWTLKYKIK